MDEPVIASEYFRAFLGNMSVSHRSYTVIPSVDLHGTLVALYCSHLITMDTVYNNSKILTFSSGEIWPLVPVTERAKLYPQGDPL
jgi:hypothetical protein